MEKVTKAPNTLHAEGAWLNFLVEADEGFKYNSTRATFCPNAILDWHTSTPKKEVSYIAIYGRELTIWTEKISKEYYTKKAGKV